METSRNRSIFQNIRSRELNGFRVRKRPCFADDSLPRYSRIGAFDYGHEDEISPPMALSFCKTSRNAHILAVTGEDGYVCLYNTRLNFPSSSTTAENTDKARKCEWLAHDNAVFDLCWTKDDTNLLTACGDHSIKIWDSQERKCLLSLTGHTGSVKFISAHPAINQIRPETRATIKVDSSKAEAEDCIISISAKEVFEDTFSPAIEAALRLQPRCSERIERDSGLISYTTRLLVPSSRIGSLIGKGGSIITEIRRISRANIRIISKEDLPKVAEDDDEMVQISADLDLAKDALLQVISRLRANLFEREGAMSTLVPVLPYLPVAPDVSKYDARDFNAHERGRNDLPASDGYGSYGSLQGRSGGDAYGAYGSYSSGRSGSSGGSRHNPASRRREYDY